MATLAHRLLSEANSPKPAGLRKTSRPLWGAGRYQDGARLLPSPLGKQAVGLAALARPPDTTTLHDSGELLTVCSWPERYWELREEQRGTGVGTQAAPPPTHQCPPLSGRSWPLLPLGEKALFSLAATDGACGWRMLGH